MTSNNKQDEHGHIEEHILKKFEVYEFKGKGAYGIVWRAMDKKTKQIVALKKVFDAFQNATDAQRTYREVVFLQQLTEHENIVRLCNVIRSENNKDLYMVFEFMETDLHKVIRANLLNDLHKQFIIYQLLKCLKYIHSGDLIHRDLKPSNLLIDSECQIKVADFGLARSVAYSENDEQNPIMTEYVATRWYRAPEILFGSQKYSKAVDMWSVGCILGEMINGKAIFAGVSSLNQIEKVIELIGRPKPEDIESIQAPLANQILANYPQTNKKKTFAQFFHGASDDALDFLRNLLVFNPNNRMTVEEALNHKYMKDFKGTEDEPIMSSPITIPFNDNKKYTIKDYREALYKGLTIKKKDERQQLQSLHTTLVKVKDVVNRPSTKSGQSQSFHQNQKELSRDDNYSMGGQSNQYSSVNAKSQSNQGNYHSVSGSNMLNYNSKATSSSQKGQKQNYLQKSYSHNQNEIPDRSVYSHTILDEEMPTVHKHYISKPDISMTASHKPTYNSQNKNHGYKSEENSKENSRSLSQSDDIKKQLLAEVGYNFNHYQNNKNLYKYGNKVASIRQNAQSNSFLVQRSSKPIVPSEQKQLSQTNQTYVFTKAPDLLTYLQPQSNTTTPYRSKSYERQQGAIKMTPNRNVERTNSKQSKISVGSPFHSESKSNSNAHSRNKTSIDRNSRNNLTTQGSCKKTIQQQVLLKNDRQQTQPQLNLQTSLNSVQKLLAKCTNPSFSSSKKNSFTNYHNQYKPKTHNKSNSYMDVSQFRQVNNTGQSFNYFEKQLHSRNSSFKGSKFK